MVGPVTPQEYYEANTTGNVVWVVVGKSNATCDSNATDVYYSNRQIETQKVNEEAFKRSPSRDLRFLYRAPVVKDVNRKAPRIIHQPTWRKGRWKSLG
jgi:ribosomal protein RSM22 (predicted rRNA methylase)